MAALMQLGEYKSAIDDFNQLIRIDPNNAQVSKPLLDEREALVH